MHSCWKEDKLLISGLKVASWSGHDKVYSPKLRMPDLPGLTLSVLSGFRSVLKWGSHAKLSCQHLSPPSWCWWAGALPSHRLPLPVYCRHECEILFVLTCEAMPGSEWLYQVFWVQIVLLSRIRASCPTISHWSLAARLASRKDTIPASSPLGQRTWCCCLE